jgi:hypothetical protein
MWIIVIGSQIMLINFFILNIICEPIIIVHISSVSIHAKIRCVPKCSPLAVYPCVPKICTEVGYWSSNPDPTYIMQCFLKK